MDRTNIEQYYCSLIPVKEMLKEGVITHGEYNKAEEFLASKYCIKMGDIYRDNDLINTPFRVIYSTVGKEAKAGERNNKNTNITRIEKKA